MLATLLAGKGVIIIRSNFTYNGITFNTLVRSSGYKADFVNGSNVGIRDTITSVPGFDGVERYKSFYRDRLIEIRGFILGESESDLYDNITALENAFDIHALENLFTDGFAPLAFTDPGQNSTIYYCKPIKNTLTLVEKKTGNARPFAILLEAKDPNKYLSTANTVTITPNISGGSSAFPVAFPVAFAGSSLSGSTTINNTGKPGILPILITITGPCTAPRISNDSEGNYIEFTSDLVVAAGESLIIDPNVGTCYLQAVNGSQTNVIQYLTDTSIFWSFISGNNNLTASAATMSEGCTFVISYQLTN